MAPTSKRRSKSTASPAAKRDKEATRQRIVNEARRTFSERGLAGARIDQIAAAAGVSKAMIYYHHPSKEHLYKSVLAEIMGDIAEATRRELDREEFRPEDFRQVLHITFDIFRHNADVARLLLRELTNGAPYVKQIRQEQPEHFHAFGLAVDRIEGYIESGSMRDVPAERYLLALMALSLTIVASFPSGDLFIQRPPGAGAPPTTLDDWRDVVSDIFIKSML